MLSSLSLLPVTVYLKYQGSILGPLLFMAFTTDLASIPLISKLYMYANDVVLFHFIHLFEASASTTINFYDYNVHSVAEWASISLSLSHQILYNLNPFKSSLLIASSLFLSCLSSFNICINFVLIPCSSYHKNIRHSL